MKLSADELVQHSPDALRHVFTLNRRQAMKLFGSGLVVCAISDARGIQESGRRASSEDERAPHDIASWVHISADDRVTVFTGKAEMGQNIRTSLSQQVAEELRASIDSISLTMADTELTPFDMGTFGSRTTPQMGIELRTICAAAREILVDMAAERMRADRAKLVAANGAVTNTANHQSLRYGELTAGQQIVKAIPADPALADPAKWLVAGAPVKKIGARKFVTGKHQYTSDLSRPGMLYGKVLRPDSFNATLLSLDTKDVDQSTKVKIVRDGDFVGFVAPDSTSAHRAIKAMKAKWKAPQQISEAQLYHYLRKNPAPAEAGGQGSREHSHEQGSVDKALASADKKIQATYTVAYIQHAPLEPRAALAEWSGDKLTVWTGTQRPFAVRDDLAQAFHLSTDKVRVIVPDTGSAYGGKHTGEAAIEAARLAKAAGAPVKLIWTREEEFTWAYFRPAGVIDVRAGAQKDGILTAWEFHNYNSGPARFRPNMRFRINASNFIRRNRRRCGKARIAALPPPRTTLRERARWANSPTFSALIHSNFA